MVLVTFSCFPSIFWMIYLNILTPIFQLAKQTIGSLKNKKQWSFRRSTECMLKSHEADRYQDPNVRIFIAAASSSWFLWYDDSVFVRKDKNILYGITSTNKSGTTHQSFVAASLREDEVSASWFRLAGWWKWVASSSKLTWWTPRMVATPSWTSKNISWVHGQYRLTSFATKILDWPYESPNSLAQDDWANDDIFHTWT